MDEDSLGEVEREGDVNVQELAFESRFFVRETKEVLFLLGAV